MTNVLKLLRELIALPSVNPAFLPARDPRAGEHRVAEFLARRAEACGLETEFQPVFPKRNNLLVRLAPAGRRRHRLVLAPHLDTVGGEDRGGSLFTPRQQSNRLYGRGACDTKGSVAVMFEALGHVARHGPRPVHTEIVFAGLVDEECGQGGSRMLAADRFPADLAVVGEPTRLKIATAHKGVLWLQLRTRGKEAHGARPELGRNAVHTMARVVDALYTGYTACLRQRRHSLLGFPTLNVGCIRGGRQPNIVPSECVISLDRRTLPGEEDRRVIREIKTYLRQAGLTVSLERDRSESCRPLATNPRSPWVRQMLHCLRQKAPAGVNYFSDAGVLAQGGIPSVVFGPGDIAQAHTPDEWIDVRQVERARDMLIRFLQSLP